LFFSGRFPKKHPPASKTATGGYGWSFGAKPPQYDSWEIPKDVLIQNQKNLQGTSHGLLKFLLNL